MKRTGIPSNELLLMSAYPELSGITPVVSQRVLEILSRLISLGRARQAFA